MKEAPMPYGVGAISLVISLVITFCCTSPVGVHATNDKDIITIANNIILLNALQS